MSLRCAGAKKRNNTCPAAAKIRGFLWREKNRERKAYFRAWRKKNKESVRLYQRAWRVKNKERRREYMKIYSKAHHQKYNYGITLEQKKALFLAQGNCCAICGNGDHGGIDWCTDHCHETGRIRGILCNACNKGLGHLKDKITILYSAIRYLKKYK